jgi:predicted PurR-regulated permease PerM
MGMGMGVLLIIGIAMALLFWLGFALPITSNELEKLNEMMTAWDDIIGRLNQLDSNPNQSQLITLSSDMRLLIEQFKGLNFSCFKWIAYSQNAEYLVQFRIELTKALSHYKSIREGA